MQHHNLIGTIRLKKDLQGVSCKYDYYVDHYSADTLFLKYKTDDPNLQRSMFEIDTRNISIIDYFECV